MHTHSTSFLLMIILLLILLSAFISASEISLMSINRYRLRHSVKKGVVAAKRVDNLLKQPDKFLSAVIIANTVSNIICTAITTFLAGRLYGDIGIAVGTALLTLVILIFGEIAPKTVANIYSQKIAFMVSLPLTWGLKLMSPIIFISNSLSRGFLRLVGFKFPAHKTEHLSGEELKTMVHEAGSLIPDDHKKMLMSIFDLEKASVEDIMIPRNEIIGIDIDEDWEEILLDLESSQHTRLPIYHESMDNVVGTVHMRDILNLMAENNLNKETLTEIADENYFVPEGTPLNTQLLNFKKEKRRVAFVVDEYGDIQGLVTIEDILEEIVGEFTTDIAAFSKEVYRQKDGSVLVDGGTLIRDLNRMMGWHLPTEGAKTINGMIVEYLQTIPPSRSCLKINGHAIEIILVKEHIVKTAKIFPMNHEHT